MKQEKPDLLRDTIWQFIGVLIAIAALGFAVFVWFNPSGREWVASLLYRTANVIRPDNKPLHNPYYPYNGTIILSDDMRGNATGYRWDEISPVDSNTQACVFEGDGYHVIEPLQAYKPCHAYFEKVNDFTFETNMRIVSGGCGGISFGEQEVPGHAYAFLVCQSGAFTLVRFDSLGKVLTLKQGKSDYIRPGIGQTNKIAVVASIGSITLYVNNEKVDEASDTTYDSGWLGVASDASTEAVFTDSKAWTTNQ